jgi:hypothetical protein
MRKTLFSLPWKKKSLPRRKSGDLNQALTSDAMDEFLGEDYKWYREALAGSSRYAEYGVGTSTLFVDKTFSCEIKAVETDEIWARGTADVLPGQQIIHVDLGPIGKFGRPKTYDFSHKFREYFEAPFSEGFKPDVVLVDGRFRVACFLTALKMSSPGTVIFFDDYPYRWTYHVVENVIRPEKVSRRLAKFIRPEKIDIGLINKLIDQFEMVMD